MKIAVNTRFLIKDKLEGIGWFTHEVLRRLVKDHPEHEFHFFFDRSYDSSFIFGPNVIPHVLAPPARHPVLWWWWFEVSVKSALKKIQPDVFLSPDGYLSLSSPTRTVLVTHDIAFEHHPEQVPWLVRNYYRYFMPRFHRRAERIVTVSKFTKKDIVNRYRIEPSRIDVACNGCRSEFQPLTAIEKSEVRGQYSDGAAYFFYIGAVHPRKNVHRLIAAFDCFKKRTGASVKLLIAGRFGWQTGEVKTAYEKALFKEDIVFLGYVADKELPRLMGAALTLTYVSLFEGFGVPVLEAMYAEVPVITSYRTGTREVAGNAAKLVDPLLTDQMAIVMQTLYENPEERQELVAKGRIQRKKFSWERATEVVYKSLLQAAGESSKVISK